MPGFDTSASQSNQPDSSKENTIFIPTEQDSAAAPVPVSGEAKIPSALETLSATLPARQESAPATPGDNSSPVIERQSTASVPEQKIEQPVAVGAKPESVQSLPPQEPQLVSEMTAGSQTSIDHVSEVQSSQITGKENPGDKISKAKSLRAQLVKGTDGASQIFKNFKNLQQG